MKIIRIKAPQAPDLAGAGKCCIQPLKAWTEKGFHWSRQIKWTLQCNVIPVGSCVYKISSWVNPEYLVEKGDLVRLENGRVCRCKICLEGRKEVAAGWRPL